MEKNIYYPLDYGWYDSKEKWTSFCSSKCRCFSECSGKGGFCTSIERRDIQSENKDGRIPVNSGDEPRRKPLFGISLLKQDCFSHGGVSSGSSKNKIKAH